MKQITSWLVALLLILTVGALAWMRSLPAHGTIFVAARRAVSYRRQRVAGYTAAAGSSACKQKGNSPTIPESVTADSAETSIAETSANDHWASHSGTSWLFLAAGLGVLTAVSFALHGLLGLFH
jgi:hypothetical protein